MIVTLPFSAIRHRVSLSLGTVSKSLFSLLFPWQCPGCSSLLEYPKVVCEACERQLVRINAPHCKRCGAPFPQHWMVKVCAECHLRRPVVTKIRSAFEYEGLVAQMIKEAKYLRKGRYLRYFAGQLFVLARSEFPSSIKAIVPVPMHRDREWKRTFNQAETLARGIGELWNLPLWKVLQKTGTTVPQSSLSGSVRRRNLQSAFRFTGGKRCPKSVLLVDDVITTGSTLSECARVLKRNGVKRVFGVTIARAELR